MLYGKLRRFGPAALAGLVVALAAGPSAAAPAGVFAAFFCPADEIPFIGELMPPIVAVLEEPAVQAELALTGEQLEKIRQIEKTYETGIRDVLLGREGQSRELLAGGDNERHVLAIGKMSEESRKKTNEALSRRQIQRMQEIVLQRFGLLFIPRKDLRQMLELSREQERGIDEIKSRIFARISETAAPERATVAPNRCTFATHPAGDMAAFLGESAQAARKLLSPEQLRTLEKFEGKPFAP